MKIDAHQHFWNLDKVKYPWLTPEFGPIYRNFEAPDLEPLIRAAGIDKTIIVQAADSYEDTEYMLETADRYDWVAGVVGWVPLNRPEEACEKINHFAGNHKFKGIRHLIHGEKDPNWLIQDSAMEGLKILAASGLTFDLVAVLPGHLQLIPIIAREIPDLKIVIDHLAKPPIKAKGWEPWAELMARAAEFPQVYGKVSGLNTAADEEHWTAEDLKPYTDYVFQIFGPQRLMFGSDWPVALLAGDYAKVWKETNKAMERYTQADRDAILGGTAVDFYKI